MSKIYRNSATFRQFTLSEGGVISRNFSSLDSCLGNVISALSKGEAVDVLLGDTTPTLLSVKLIDSGADSTYKIEIIDDEVIVGTFNGTINRLAAVRAFVQRLKNGNNQEQILSGDFIVSLNAGADTYVPPSGGGGSGGSGGSGGGSGSGSSADVYVVTDAVIAANSANGSIVPVPLNTKTVVITPVGSTPKIRFNATQNNPVQVVNGCADTLEIYDQNNSVDFTGLSAATTTWYQITSGNIITALSSSGDGYTGLSAYEVALANGFVGTAAEWLDSLIGPARAGGGEGAAIFEVTEGGLSVIPLGTSSVFVRNIGAQASIKFDADEERPVEIANSSNFVLEILDQDDTLSFEVPAKTLAWCSISAGSASGFVTAS